ncbi:MAG: hypothetical protein GXX08_07435 [Firmicutes bacterium]|nr:hypothetical protein [Bacillota bacterium]
MLESLSELDWGSLAGKMGLGAVLGLAVGYATKKAIKVALLVVAVLLAANIALSKAGFITIHWNALDQWWSSAVMSRGAENIASSWIGWFTSSIAVTGSFIVGFVIGFRAG